MLQKATSIDQTSRLSKSIAKFIEFQATEELKLFFIHINTMQRCSHVPMITLNLKWFTKIVQGFTIQFAITENIMALSITTLKVKILPTLWWQTHRPESCNQELTELLQWEVIALRLSKIYTISKRQQNSRLRSWECDLIQRSALCQMKMQQNAINKLVMKEKELQKHFSTPGGMEEYDHTRHIK